MTSEIRVIPISGIKEVVAGDDLGALLCDAAGPAMLQEGDVLVVTQKVVSKAEGRFGSEADRDELIRQESARVLRRSPGGMVIAQTRHGFVCANAGVDASNVPPGTVALLPLDPDLSARRIKASIKQRLGVDVGVIISDTFGRAWRVGQTDVAIGVAGVEPLIDMRGRTDADGRLLNATVIAVADEISGAAEMVMGKAERICAAIVRGAPVTLGRASATELVRAPIDDFFR